MNDDELIKQQFENQLSDADAKLETDQRPREQLLVRLIVGQTIAVTFLTIMTAIGGLSALLPLGGIAVAVGLVSYWLLRRRQFRLGGYFFLMGTSVAITATVFMRGYQDSSGIYYLWPILSATMLLGTREGILVTTFSAISYLIMVVIQRLGYQTPVFLYSPEKEALLTVGSRVVMFYLLAFLTWLSAESLNRALQQARRAVQRWRELNETLELRVAGRTRELNEITADLASRSQELESANIQLAEVYRHQEAINRELQEVSERTRRRAVQLQAVAEVGRSIARVRELGVLLLRVTQLISRHFGHYHVGIFLVDEARRYAVLRAANSEGGQRMLARHHKLAVGAEGVVGYVTSVGEPRIAIDVGTDAARLANPDMPDTRSEIALPLRLGDEIIGALDIQSIEAQAFDNEDVTVLSVLADQVAIAIENAHLFQQSQEALAEAEEVQRRYLQQGWQQFMQQRSDLRFEYTLEGVPSALDVELPTTKQAVMQEELVATSEVATGGDNGVVVRAALSIPIKLHGRVIGVIDLHEADEARVWTEHEVALTRSVADQIAQALESARLFEQTQARAHREQVVSQITTRMRTVSNVQDILQVASEELGKALGVSRSVVRLRPQGASEQVPEEAIS
jgi:GAF domain-containing protein